MYEELDPLGYPESPEAAGRPTLSELVAQHPMVAVAASAAVGAGVMALVAMAMRPPATRSATDSGATQRLYSDLLSQLSGLADKVNASLPDKTAMAQTVDHLRSEAAHGVDAATDAARRALHSAMATGTKATQAASEHPVLTAVVLGAVGAVAAALTAQAQRSAAHDAQQPVPNGHDNAPVDAAPAAH